VGPLGIDLVNYGCCLAPQVAWRRVLSELFHNLSDRARDIVVELHFAQPKFKDRACGKDVDGVESFHGVVVSVFVVDLADRWECVEDLSRCDVQQELSELPPILKFLRRVDALCGSPQHADGVIVPKCLAFLVTERKFRQPFHHVCCKFLGAPAATFVASTERG
jgi:hypothetical protein